MYRYEGNHSVRGNWIQNPAGSEQPAAAQAETLRAMAAELLAMARDLEPDAEAPLAPEQPFAGRASELTDKAAMLDRTAQDYVNRRQRRRYFPVELFAEPAWDLLLDLFQARLEGKMITVTSACIAADVPPTTALRWLGVLEQHGLIERSRNLSDQRSTWVRLTDSGMTAMVQYTEGCQTRARRSERLAEQGMLIPIRGRAA